MAIKLGSWRVSYASSWSTIYQGSDKHRFRISGPNQKDGELLVKTDSTRTPGKLVHGETMDVAGKKITIKKERGKSSWITGNYEALD